MKDEDKKTIVEEQILSPSGGEVVVKSDEKEIGEETDLNLVMQIFEKEVQEEYSEKYQDKLRNLAIEDPSQVMIETPDGWMVLSEAYKKGYNVETGEFDDETAEEARERIIAEEGLNEEEANRVRQMTTVEGEPAPVEEEPAPAEEAPVEGTPIEGAPAEEAPAKGAPAGIDPNLLGMLGGV